MSPDQPQPYQSIVHAFCATCARTPAKPCLHSAGSSFSYAQLSAAARTWAQRLRESDGLQPGERVALFLGNSPAFLAAYLGIHLAHGIVVLVNIQYRRVELQHILSDSGARICITDPERSSQLAPVRADLPTLEVVHSVPDETLPPIASDAAPPPEPPYGLPAPDAVALLGYTSGTTGRSKGAMLTHANLAANSTAVTTAWRWTADDLLLLTLPLFHIHGLGVGMHGAWLTGSSVDLRPRFDAAEVFTTLLQGHVTMFFGVPTMYTRLIAEAQARGQRPPPIRLYVSGSAPLDVQTFAAFERLFGQPILERYGMTETVMNLTNPYEGERRPGTVGQPFPGQEARIVDVATRQPIADERPGEIEVRGPNVFKGYWQRPDATAEVFDSAGWFSTGDLGWRSADGYYTISGRAKELIISGGYNIYPREVEEVLLGHPDVAEVAVVGLPDPDMGEQVVAAVVLATGAPAEAQQAAVAASIVELCRAQLAAYKKPRRVVFLDALPRNALGKVQKHLLRERLQGQG